MKRTVISFVALLLCANVFAQSENDLIFKAMQDELDRNMNELKMENVEKPFHMSYAIFSGDVLTVEASLGAVIKVDERPIRNYGVKMLLGDYDCTSDCDYNNRFLTEKSAVENDYGQIRREFWYTSDILYRRMATDYATKLSIRKQRIRTPEEEKLPDLLPVQAVKKVVESPEFDLNREKWVETITQLSKIFEKYPELFDSKVTLDANDFAYYVTTSEGVVMRQPIFDAMVMIEASVRAADGSEYSDNLCIYAPTDKTLPCIHCLSKKVDEFAKELVAYSKAPVIDEFYSGPVLFENETVSSMFEKNLISEKGILASRQPESMDNLFGMLFGISNSGSKRTLEYRIGQRVLDNRLSVVNRTDLKEYAGMPLMGYYEIDANGVIPEAETVLIDSGMMRKLLNGSIPTLKTPYTTGSQRFQMEENSISSVVAPGTILVKASEGKSRAELIDEMLDMAKADGLTHAYIIKKTGGVNYVYKVDGETKEETLVQKVDVTIPALGQLRKLAGISNGEYVSNYMFKGRVPCSIVTPDAILFENIELCEKDITKNKMTPIVNPTERM